jgi:tryptophan 7-halogenase
MSSSSEALRSEVAKLGVPYGRERSCKLGAGGIFCDRFLLSVHRAALGSDPLRRVTALLQSAGMPDGLENDLTREWPGADVVHFGYEATDGAEVCKVYFERVERVRQAMVEPPSTEPVQVHRAWKWPLPATNGYAATDYTWCRMKAGESVIERISELCDPAGDAHPGVRAVRSIRDLIGGRARFDDLMLLEVAEEGTARRSFDLNLYPADVALRDIEPAIERLRGDFGLTRQQTDDAFAPARDLSLGHISGGSGRGGEPFVTIYFGVEAC